MVSAVDRVLKWLPVATAVVLFLLLTVRPIQDYDTWWHLRTGAYVLENGLPTNDVLTHTATSHRWVVPDWLCDILFCEVYRAGGPTALTLLMIASFLAAFVVLLRVCALRGIPPVVAGVTLVLVVLVARVRFVERPLIFKYLLSGLWIWGLESYRLHGRRWFWWLLPLQAAWVNLHSSYVVGIALPCAYAGALWLEGTLLRREGTRSPWPCAAFAAACLAACFVDPRGPATLAYPFRLATTKTMRALVDELAPLWSWPFAPNISWWLGLFAFAALWVLASVRAVRRGPLCDLAVSLPFAYLAFNSRRFVALWAYLAAPGVAHHLAAVGKGLFERRLRLVAFAPAAAVVALFVWPRGIPLHRLSFGIDPDHLPVHALEYVNQHGLSGNAYNSFDIGGMIEWECWPRVKTFSDGRGMVFGDAFIDWLVQVEHGGAAWEEAQKRYDLTLAIVSLPTAEGNPGPTIPYREFFPRPAWRLVEWDDDAAVYLRDVPANAEAIRRDAYEVVDASDGSLEWVKEDQLDLLARDLDRCLARHPHCLRARCLRGMLRARKGETAAAMGDLEEVVEKWPQSSGPSIALAGLYLQAGRVEEAKRVLDRLRACGGETPASEAIRERLEGEGY